MNKSKSIVGQDVSAILNKGVIPPREERGYIGGSTIGKPCAAYQAMSLRGFNRPQLEKRVFRIFRDGHRIEEQAIEDLQASMVVLPVDLQTRKQWVAEAAGGHLKSNLDGVVLIDPMNAHNNDGYASLEIKSMKHNLFDDLVDRGLRASNPKYFDQVQFGMGMHGLKWSLFVAYNKNTSLYHHEWVPFDVGHYQSLLGRAESGMGLTAERAVKWNWFKDELCMWCDFKRYCHNVGKQGRQEVAEKKCSTCAFSVAEQGLPGQRWQCTKHKRLMSRDDLCSDWKAWSAQ